MVYNVFEAVDVITLIKGGVYDDLNLTVGEALKKRSPVCFLFFSFSFDSCCRASPLTVDRTFPASILVLLMMGWIPSLTPSANRAFTG